MCIPCWPWVDLYFEDEEKKKKKKKKEKKKEGIVVFDPKIQQWVKITGVDVSFECLP